ncbi:HPP [Shewanella denitrificans OS217]|jgi:CBS-domain-containing membrane protein|uniref:HPP n=1 Tax=Shewanella denitrificans (strain OS217 / ATCC BAA-1090 / DSM 15013) TaxID=318161 RepID=Q12RT5_SHEDO|nr:HPP family protein [Shewanella denitrificans]ABE53841.1 HPP [Shewanella denitrificans OS217]
MNKLKGGGSLPPRPSLLQLLKGLIGGTLGILCLCLLGQYSGVPWLMAPFGATCVILFAAPTSPLAQPRNVIGGHFIAASVGIAALYGLGDSYITMSVAVGVAIVAMQFLRAVHPPAGANPIVIILAGKSAVSLSFLFTPVLVGSVLLVVIASLVNNYGVKDGWPVYWHGFGKT